MSVNNPYNLPTHRVPHFDSPVITAGANMLVIQRGYSTDLIFMVRLYRLSYFKAEITIII